MSDEPARDGHVPNPPVPIPTRLGKPWVSAAPRIVLEWYEDLRAQRYARNTARNYAADLKEFAAFLREPLETATAANLRAYRRDLAVRNLSAATCARRITAVREFYDWLRRRDELAISPAADLRPPKVPERVHHFWTKGEVARFRRGVHWRRPHDASRSGHHGTRAHGPAGERGDRVDPSGIRELDVPARAGIVVKRKGGGEQYVPLTSEARRALRAWLGVRPPEGTTLVFFGLRRRGPRMDTTTVEKMLKRYAEMAGVTISKGIAFHLLQHPAGQRMSDVGLGIEEAQRVLGHRSPRTTQVYYQVGDKRLRKAVRRLRY